MGRGKFLPPAVLAIFVVPTGLALAGERFIAYEVPEGTRGNQDIGGITPIGMDFDVNLRIDVTRLGVFDSGADGLFMPLTARLFDRDTTLEVRSLTFTPADPGELIGGSRFKDLDPPLELVAGFHGSIVCYGQGPTEQNGNTFGGSSAGLWSTNAGHCAISFVGASRYGTGDTFPATVDTGPVNRYAAGTFEFEQLEESVPSPAIAYVVAEFTTGNYTYSGPLGMDFDVRTDILVDRLGVFDSGSDGLLQPITATLYDRGTRAELARLEFTEADPGDAIAGSLFKPLGTPLPLPAGSQCTIVAEGYGDLEPAGNLGGPGGIPGMSTDQGGCSIDFVGFSRYSLLPGQYPDKPDFGPAVRFAAGTFSFIPAPAPLERPLPPTGVGAAAAAGGVKITWTAPAGPAVAGYNIYTSSPGAHEKLNGAPVASTQFTAPVVKGVDLCFVVRSVRSDGIESLDSIEACTNLPPGGSPSPTYIAYQIPAGAVGQTRDLWAGTLGLDFDTRTSVVVTRLGVFDDGSDGLNATLIARLFDRDTQGELATLGFSKQDPGDLIGGARFKDLPEPIVLPAGFRGTITAEGYTTTERYGNQTIAAIDVPTDDGGCALVFQGPRFGDPGTFPIYVPLYPPNPAVYVGGTFEYGVGEPPPGEPNSGIAYVVPAGTLGNQDFPGSLGLDFNVEKAIRVTRLGVFDDGSDGLNQTITAILFDRDSQGPLATLDFTTDDPGEPIGGSRFKDLPTPIDLSVGFHGTMVAQGYGILEMNGNKHGNQDPGPWTTFSGNCRIAFLGGARHSGLAPAYPQDIDWGPADRYGAGTFVFGPGPDVDFTVSPGTEGEAAFQVSLNASGTSSLNGAIKSYSWDFGDGTVDTGVTASHTYPIPDRYKVTLTVVDASEATASISKSITVLFRSGDVSPWTSVDIGSPPPSVVGGARRFDGGCLDVYAGGTDINSTADQFHFLYQQFPGDGSITARFSEVDWESGAKIGLMFREDLTPGSRFIAVFFQKLATTKALFVRRLTAGSPVNLPSTSGNSVTFPDAWLKLERIGDEVTASLSIDGVNPLETPKKFTFKFPAGCFGGIAATSREAAGRYFDLTAKVCEIQVTGIASPPAAPTGLVAAAGDGKVNLNWNDNGEADLQGYDVYRSDAGGPFNKVNGSPVSQSDYEDPSLTNGTEYCYRVKAVSPAGASPDSNQDCATPTGGVEKFKRGDVDGNNLVELTDVINSLGYQFLGTPNELDCFDAADADDNSLLELTDAIVTLGFLYLGTAVDLVAPGAFACGPDKDLGDTFPACVYTCQ